MTYTALYFRYGGSYDKQFDTIEQAQAFFTAGEEEGSMSSVAVIDERGEIVSPGWPFFKYDYSEDVLAAERKHAEARIAKWREYNVR